jgi:methylase of polypeptide subunit release factors
MSLADARSFPLHPQLPGFEAVYDPTQMLPPDSATVSMAFLAVNMSVRTEAAKELYTDEGAGGINVTDLGSGSGIIGMAALAAAPNLKSITAVDIDPHTLPTAARNLEEANFLRQQRGMSAVACNVLRGDWNDPRLWESIGPAELTISNPPYLIAGDPVRPGYEHTPSRHVYVADEAELAATYASLISQGVRALREWDILVLRLPRASKGRMEWVVMAGQLISATITEAAKPSYYALHSRRAAQRGPRPLHTLTIERLPLDYPAINPSNDARVDIYLRHGRDPGRLTTAPARRPNQMLLIEDIV